MTFVHCSEYSTEMKMEWSPLAQEIAVKGRARIWRLSSKQEKSNERQMISQGVAVRIVPDVKTVSNRQVEPKITVQFYPFMF